MQYHNDDLNKGDPTFYNGCGTSKAPGSPKNCGLTNCPTRFSEKNTLIDHFLPELSNILITNPLTCDTITEADLSNMNATCNTIFYYKPDISKTFSVQK